MGAGERASAERQGPSDDAIPAARWPTISRSAAPPRSQGYTLFASAFIGGPLTGAALNPARVLGPALIYDCYWNTAFIYMVAEYIGGAIAAVLAMLL